MGRGTLSNQEAGRGGFQRTPADGGPRSESQANAIALRDAAMHGDVEEVRRLIPISNPLHDGSIALRGAAGGGMAECVRLLIPVSDPLARNSHALQAAAMAGSIECVRLLIPVSDHLADDCLALEWACKGGHAECARELAALGPSVAALGKALKTSAELGKLECLEALMERVECLDSVEGALMAAAELGYAKCLGLLLSWKDSGGAIARPPARASALSVAARTGKLDCVKILIQRGGHDGASAALRSAALSGRLACVEELLPLFKPSMALPTRTAIADKARVFGQEAAAEMIEAFVEQEELQIALAPAKSGEKTPRL